MHIANILKEKELSELSVVKNFLTTAADGKNYNVVFYSLEMIIAVGYRVRGLRGTQFRQWATEHLTEYLVKGFTMDDARLKNPDGRPDYFDELLARIRDIRAGIPGIDFDCAPISGVFRCWRRSNHGSVGCGSIDIVGSIAGV